MSRNLWNTKLFTNNEHTSTFPDSRSTVLLRDDVSNRNMLKNPFNTKNEAPPIGGLRPTMITADKLGNVFARSKVGLVEGVTNINMLQNPNNNFSDPILEPRVLTMQLIKDINNKKLPKYITENKGVGELAYRLLSVMLNNGVKLMTIEMLRSYISGKKFTTLLDPGGQRVGRAIAYYEQLLSDAKKLQKLGQLDSNINLILDKYTRGLVSVFGETVLQSVNYTQIDEAMKQLALMSGVLSRLFNQQNALEPSNLVPFETLMGLDRPINSLTQHNDPNFFLKDQIKNPDITEIPLQPVQENPTPIPTVAPTAEVPIQAQEGIKPPVLEKEAKSNIIRNALIAGGLTAAAIGIAYFYNVGIGIERARQAQAIVANQAFLPPPGAGGGIPVVPPIALAGVAGAAAGLPPAVDAVGVGGALADGQQAANVAQAIVAQIADQVPQQVDLAGGVADAVMGDIEEEKDEPAQAWELAGYPDAISFMRDLPEYKVRTTVLPKIAKRRIANAFKKYLLKPSSIEKKNIANAVVGFAEQQGKVKIRDKAKSEASSAIDNILKSVVSISEKKKQLEQVALNMSAVVEEQKSEVLSPAEEKPPRDDTNELTRETFDSWYDANRDDLNTTFDDILDHVPVDIEVQKPELLSTAMYRQLISVASVPQLKKLYEALFASHVRFNLATNTIKKENVEGLQVAFKIGPNGKAILDPTDDAQVGSFKRNLHFLMEQNIKRAVEFGKSTGKKIPEFLGKYKSMKDFEGTFKPFANMFDFGKSPSDIVEEIKTEIFKKESSAKQKSMFQKLALKVMNDYVSKHPPEKQGEKKARFKNIFNVDDEGNYTKPRATNAERATYDVTLTNLLKEDIVNNVYPEGTRLYGEKSKKSTGNGRKRSAKKAHTTKVTSKEIKNIDDEIMRILTRR